MTDMPKIDITLVRALLRAYSNIGGSPSRIRKWMRQRHSGFGTFDQWA